MKITKKAIIALALLLAIMAPAIYAQGSVSENPLPASDYTGFYNPLGIAVDSANNIYVTDNHTSSVWKFSPSGEVITHWGSNGSGKGQFGAPTHIAIDRQDFVYIVDVGNARNYRIQRFSSDGTYISHWDFLSDTWTECDPQPVASMHQCGEKKHKPGGIATDLKGNLYIVDWSNNSILKATPDGKYLAKWGSKGTGDGQFDNPDDIAVDREGNVFVSDQNNNRVQKFSADGTFLNSFGSKGTADGQFDHPNGIGIDQRGFVYVIEFYRDRVQKFTSSGTFVTGWGTEGGIDGDFNNPSDVAVDGNGNVYVTDYGNHRVQKFTTNGSFLLKWSGSPAPTPKPTPRFQCDNDEVWMNITEQLTYKNEKLHWGFSDGEISQHSEKIQNTLDKKYITGKDWIHVCYSQFSKDLEDIIGITEEQRIALLFYQRNVVMVNPGQKTPEIPYFSINGKVTDPDGRPVPDAVVRFESNLVLRKTQMQNWVDQDTPLSSTISTGTDGTYHFNVVWGDKQNVSVTKDGFLNYSRTGINLTNESNTIDCQLTPLARQTASAPGFLFFPVVFAIILAWLIAVRNR
jgi:sugar lactone lactonase YvrE